MNDRNFSIDILRFICAFLVVLQHVPAPWSECVLPLTRVAVPIFFMMSGYLLFDYDKNVFSNNLIKSIKRVSIIFLWSMILYIVCGSLVVGNYPITRKAIIELIIFNRTPNSSFVLWYISAYIYILFIVLFFNKKEMLNKLICAIPFLLLYSIIFSTYNNTVLTNPAYTRNFLLGLPYFMIGTLIRKQASNINYLAEIWSNNFFCNNTAGTVCLKKLVWRQ